MQCKDQLHTVFEFLQTCKNETLLLFYEIFQTCKKLNSCVVRFFKFAKNGIHICVLSLEKMEFILSGGYWREVRGYGVGRLAGTLKRV